MLVPANFSYWSLESNAFQLREAEVFRLVERTVLRCLRPRCGFFRQTGSTIVRREPYFVPTLFAGKPRSLPISGHRRTLCRKAKWQLGYPATWHERLIGSHA